MDAAYNVQIFVRAKLDPSRRLSRPVCSWAAAFSDRTGEVSNGYLPMRADDSPRLWRALVATLVVSLVLFLAVLIHIWHECCGADASGLPRATRQRFRVQFATARPNAEESSPLGDYQPLGAMAPAAQQDMNMDAVLLHLPEGLVERPQAPQDVRGNGLLDPAVVEAQLRRLVGVRKDEKRPAALTSAQRRRRYTSPSPATVRVNMAFHVLRIRGANCTNDPQPRVEAAANASIDVVLRPSTEDEANDKIGVGHTAAIDAAPAAIDFVVTYVNPFRIDGSLVGDPQRVRDWNELYWNLRSMFYNGRLCVFQDQPDRCLLGRIHLVVASRAHVPTWLSRRLAGPDANGTGKLELRFREFLRERLNVVEHKDMFPPGTPYSEAYNSNVIELNLHRIPGLSPFYLYFNNDMFLGRELRLQDLFTPIASPAQSMHCDLLPITWYEPDPTFRRPYAESPFASPFISQQHDVIEQMLHHTVEVLKTTSHLRWRSSLSPANDLPLLQYAHVPMLYDRAPISRILDDREVRPALRETLGHPVARQPHDIWVPLLYINVRFVAVYDGSDATQSRVFRVARGNMYEFSMLTGTVALHSNYVRLGRYNNAAPAPLFVTLNDDFPASLPATAADPSTLLLGGEELRCESAFVDTEARIVEKAIGRDLVNRDDWVRAVRNLFHMHELYCGWEKIWAGNKV